MRKFVFLLTMSMMLFARIASASVMQVENIQYHADVGIAPAIMMDAQASVYDVDFESVTMSFELHSMECGTMDDIPVCVAEFSDVGLKRGEGKPRSLHYFAGNYDIKYRYGGLRYGLI